jgi:Co/Zn/Cd efflux system component/copper chaperone CopZ
MALKESLLKVPKMDCPSEVGLLRMALEKNPGVKRLGFNLNERTVKIVYDDATPRSLIALIQSIGFAATELETRNLDVKLLDEGALSSNDQQEHRTLVILLLINGLMFLAELGFGIYAQSTGLIADSLDMLADSLVYGISLYAIGKQVSSKYLAAKVSGWLQVLLVLGALFEVIRRFFSGSEPLSSFMITVAAIAFCANLFCLWLISKHRHGGVHMKASWIFSSNDVIANFGVIVAGTLVYFTNSNWPDLAVGLVISVVVFIGAIRILKL